MLISMLRVTQYEKTVDNEGENFLETKKHCNTILLSIHFFSFKYKKKNKKKTIKLYGM